MSQLASSRTLADWQTVLGDGFMRRLSRLGAAIVGLMLVSSAGFAAPATDVTASLEWRLVGRFRACGFWVFAHYVESFKFV